MNIRYTGVCTILGTICLIGGCGDSTPPNGAPNQPTQQIKALDPLPSATAEISFAQTTLPGYVVVSGLSTPESFGRWSVSDQVTLKFGSNLPRKFALTVRAKAFGSNAGVGIPVKIGGQVREMTLSADDFKNVRVEFLLALTSDTIQVSVPKPTVPSNGDIRAIGIAISTIKIEPLP